MLKLAFLKLRYSQYTTICRYIFSKTGIWCPELTLETKQEIELHWKNLVARNPYESSQYAKKPKFYVLAMFPYPSGNLHMGHARVYSISDAIARFHRMHGKQVIHPMGWDAFGLPAENAAKLHGVEAREWTKSNIAAMKGQLEQLGLCLDWHREVDTSSKDYYAGTQRIFLELWRAGLAYQDEAMVNWDPVDCTVLADEQVDAQGHSWRSGALVEKRLLTQWFIRTTKFSKSLLDGLDNPLLEDWRDIIALQKHWIGPCDGTVLVFPIIMGEKNRPKESISKPLKVWTSTPENSGLFVALSKSHILNQPEYLSDMQPNPDIALLLNVTTSNPLFKNSLPIIITDKVEFPCDGVGYFGVNSSETDKELALSMGLDTHQSINQEITKEEAMERARNIGVGGDSVSSHIRDWLISRQRRWGTPIPLVHCKKCGAQPVPDKDLPVILPQQNISLDEWKSTLCPKCDGPGERETDTMDTFVDSSWYFLRYLDPKNDKQPFSPEAVAPFMPVDLYVGGKEHAVLHLYYARFMGHFLHSIGWLKEPEPFRRLLVQGMVMGRSFKVKETGQYVQPSSVDTNGPKPLEKETGLEVKESWEKMSKSKFNGVDPSSVLQDVGCDAARLLLLADVAPTSHRNWSTDTYPGILGWQRRLWLTVGEFIDLRKEPQSAPVEDETWSKEEARLWDSRNYYISGTTFNYNVAQQLSVAVTKLQGLTNSIRRSSKSTIARSAEYEKTLATQIVMLAPMAPHFASELWVGFTSAKPMLSQYFDWDKPVLEQKWPEVDINFGLKFLIKLNHSELLKMKVPRHQAEIMTREQAMEIALSNSTVQQKIEKWKLVGSTFKVTPGYDVTLNLLTTKPEGYQPEPKKPMQKKVKKKKVQVA